jgi:hypothetical protein
MWNDWGGAVKPTMCFQGADAELREVGETVLRFLTVVSESHPDDVAAVLIALQRYQPPGLRPADLATLSGTIEALRLRLQHGQGGEAPRPELLMLDVSQAIRH